MIQGVHAEIPVFIEFADAVSLFGVRGWPWLGIRGDFATRRLSLRGELQPCRVRVTDMKIDRYGATCSVQIESDASAASPTPLIRAQVSLTPAVNGHTASRSHIVLRGTAARNLAGSFSTSTQETRLIANEYARWLLQHMAADLERTVGPASARGN